MHNNIIPASAITDAANSILKHKIDKLKMIPAVAVKLLRLTSDENASVADLSLLIETEPTLAAKVLRNVNSAAFALTHKITSIKRAVSILGFSSVRQLALNQLFFNKLINNRSKQAFDQLFFWQHCLFVATLSRVIAKAINHPEPDMIYSAGLMHDIGKVVFETHSKISYSDFIAACKNDEQSLFKGEHDFFGLNHAEMGFVFCQQWDIPEPIAAIVYCHHDLPSDDSPFAQYSQEISIINFANYIAWMQGIGSLSFNRPSQLHVDVPKHLDLENLDLEFLLAQVDEEMRSTREFYGIQFPSIDKLRATLIETAIAISGQRKSAVKIDQQAANVSISSLTAPHRSLEPDEIFSGTLSAIQVDFNFHRLIILTINPKRRSLEVAYSYPQSLSEQEAAVFNININILPPLFVSSLRERKAVILNDIDEENKSILTRFQTDEFLICPVLSNNRLAAILYADNRDNGLLMSEQVVNRIAPIIHELGVALANAKRFELEKQRAEMDGLTGLLNKRMVTEYLTTTFKLEQQHLERVAVGFIDIDFFKKFNDTCGHQAGDDALKIVAQIMRTLTRPSDFIGRYGGEEFVFVLRDTDKKGAHCYAERIRLEIQRKGKILSQRFHNHELSVSIGVSLYDKKFTKYEDIIEAADIAMYKAKRNGRNCVVVV